MPPRKQTPARPTPVDAIVHADKRANLPLADSDLGVSADVDAQVMLTYSPKTSSDVQLVWSGKDRSETDDLTIAAPPIYIQEKIDPRVLIESLRNSTRDANIDPAPSLFDTFDGLDELDLVEYYQHDANWSNRMVLGDSLQVMASLSERERLRGKVQMIYLDPPYGIKFNSNWQVSARNRDVKDGRPEDASREVEQIKAFRDTWALGIPSYLTYLHDRVVAARQLLSDSGSIFIQIGSTNMHLAVSVLAEIFGAENHVETVAFRKKTMPLGGRLLEGAYDYLVWFARDKERVKYRPLFQPKSVEGDVHWNLALIGESLVPLTRDQINNHTLLPPGADLVRLMPIYPVGPFATGIYDYEYQGTIYKLPAGKSWPSPRSGMDRLALAGRLQPYDKGNTLQYVLRLSDYPVTVFNNVWTDTSAATNMRFVVETSPKIIDRCILMTTDPGDLVLDPTCGSGTTAYVAEQRGRRWITIDTSRVALALARQRLMGARYPYYILADSSEGRRKEEELTGQPLRHAATTGNVRHGFVYKRARHITLKSIANNPDISDGMSSEQIDSAIGRHAEFELLYDKPYEDDRKVRVAGPFTVESLSPHRSLAFAPGSEPATERAAAVDPSAETFEQTILANLRVAGIQNGIRRDRIAFAEVESYSGSYIQAVGTREEPEGAAAIRVGVSIGPQYGTVGPQFIKAAAKEAIAAGDLELLCVLAFAFDPTVIKDDADYTATAKGFANVAAERSLGKVPVLLVRMNADLVMGEELKKTGVGNLFTVFGEPDIAILQTPDGLVVQINGVDVYDPSTGEVRSRDTDRIALWMIDTQYNDESFFVRHCYFTGGKDPYGDLRKALIAEVDEDAWASLYSTVSRPFPKPATGKIAVKVINDYGDEVMKVLDV